MAKQTIIVSPRGISQYPRLTVPDTKFNAVGVYSVKLTVPLDEVAQQRIAEIDAAAEKQVDAVKAEGKVKGKIKRADLPYVINEDTGTVTFSYKMKAKITTKEGEVIEQRPALWLANLKPAPADIKIGSGSEMKVGYTISPFYTALIGAGVSLRLRQAQLLKVVPFGAPVADGFTNEGETEFEGDCGTGTPGLDDDLGDTDGAETEGTGGDGTEF